MEELKVIISIITFFLVLSFVVYRYKKKSKKTEGKQIPTRRLNDHISYIINKKENEN